MNNNKKFLILVLSLAAVLLVAAVAYRQLSADYTPPQDPQPEEPAFTETQDEAQEVEPEAIDAPDFIVLDGGGNEVRLSDYAGMPVVLNFWATWCGPCKSELPAFENMYAEYGDDVAFLIINLTDGARDTIDGATSFVEENGYTFPVLFDTTLLAAQTYGAYSIPLTVFVFPDGTLAGGYQGAIPEELLEAGIQLILNPPQ